MSRFGEKSVTSTALHPNQVSVLNNLAIEARRLNCQPYEVRRLLAKEMTEKFLEQYVSTEDYKEAIRLGVEERLMKYVSANAFIVAQAIVSNKFPIYNLSGEEMASTVAWDFYCAPHLEDGDERRVWATTTFKQGKRLSSVEINPPSEVKKWVGYGEVSGSNNLSANSGDDFL